MASTYVSLRALANANEQMVNLCRWLDGQAEVLNVTRGSDIRVYSDSINVELFVEGDLLDGRAVCYWLEVRLAGDDCVAEADFFLQDKDGQCTLRERRAVVDREAILADVLSDLAANLWKHRHADLEQAIGRGVHRPTDCS